MFRIENDNEIHINRGDSAIIDFIIPICESRRYMFDVGDIVDFAVYEKRGFDKCPVIHKPIEVKKATDVVNIKLSEDDTRIGNLINKEVEYWYEIQLKSKKFTQTVLGYDDDGAKLFVLYPEGKDCGHEIIEEGDEENGIIEGEA